MLCAAIPRSELARWPVVGNLIALEQYTPRSIVHPTNGLGNMKTASKKRTQKKKKTALNRLKRKEVQVLFHALKLSLFRLKSLNRVLVRA